ncbi:unnamed protein product [Pylaiella littoralis]
MLPSVIVVLTGDGSSAFGSALSDRLQSIGGGSEIRSSGVMESWDGLTDVCRGADTVYLLSALDLPSSPSKRRLRDFRAGVSRVLECCQECGVGSLVFMSSSKVVSPGRKQQQQGQGRGGKYDDGISVGGGVGVGLCDESLPYVARRENEAAHSIAMAEAEVLKASETQNLGKGVLYTCALRPGVLYGTGEDEPLLRALSWVGWGLNRVTLRGLQDTKSDMVFFPNLIDATVLAGTKLADGAAGAQAGGSAGWNARAGPVCSGQAYFVTDGRPCSLQTFVDGVLQGLDFSTSKWLRLPVVFAVAIAWVAELVCKMNLVKSRPAIRRSEVHELVEGRSLSIARARKDLGYEPRVDGQTSLRIIVQDLKKDGWGRHTFLVPGLGWWILVLGGIWLNIVAAFGILCPAFLAPTRPFLLRFGLVFFRRLWIVRMVAPLAVIAHVLEGLHAFSRATEAGHRDTAPLWFIQTVILGYPSLRLLRRLLS